jgi:hypothetical protein
MQWMSNITVERLEALKPCYSRSELEGLVGDGVRPGAALKILLALPADDARWILARILSLPNRVLWAKMAAARAKRYAHDGAYAASAAYYAAHAAHADSAAYAAAYAADYAAYAARDARDAEHRMACVIGLELLVEQEHGA